MNRSSNVTVIIPCYNDGKYILQALESLLNQTLKAERIIIVDDGSNLETKEILGKLHNENIEVVFQDNAGVSKARNYAVNLAKTSFILNLDADDYFEPTFIEKAVTILNANHKIGVVGSYFKTFDATNKKIEIVKPLGGKVENFFIKNNGIASSLYRKECWCQVGGYDESMLNGYEDWEFWISILSNNWDMYIIDEVLFNYRVKKESRDKTAIENFDFDLREYIFKKHINVFLSKEEIYSIRLIKENCRLRRINRNLEESLNFKIGRMVLKSLSLFKYFKK